MSATLAYSFDQLKKAKPDQVQRVKRMIIGKLASNQKPMKYNLRFNARTKTFNAFEPDKELLEGATDGKTGSAAYYKQSYNDYTQACLVFNPSIQTFDGKSTNEFCVPVSQYSGAATSPYTNLPESEGTCNDGIQNQKETSTDCGGPCEQCKTANKPGEFDGF